MINIIFKISYVIFYCQIAKLSFCPDEEGEDDEDDSDEEAAEVDDIDKEVSKELKMVKNPDVDTSFLPDREREDAENRLREELRQVSVM